ncbi:M24 family metallopeptidase [Bradyrhizobium elkanii]|uniref:M24 family metallopeptidase n=1 Tax=Bradyrhizobium elkanii TaxID=29448 RepID=UPI001BA4E4C0|nr:Xaa-Pro peptidase family protein [Bradyrhizobium elkanii]MBR1165064.1 M24 family metallopeptidase [Bradyrhizobium elkanii]
MKKELHFERTEFSARLANVKKEMAKRGLDILMVSDPANQHYLTGYNAYSFYAPQMVIISLHRDEPTWIGRFMDAVSARMTTYLADNNVRHYPDKYVASTTLSAYDFMADVVKDFGAEKATIGVEKAGFYYSARAHEDFTKALPQARIVDADLLVNWIRIVLSPAEIALMKEAGRIADAAMERAIDTVKPGVRECDIAAAIYHQQTSGTPDLGGTYAAAPPNLCIGKRAIAPHAAWTDEPIATSASVNIELYGVRHRYQINLARTVSVGEPDPAYQKLSEIVVSALNAGLDSVRPGRTCEEVSAAFSRELARHGYEKEARVGYPLGISFPPSMQMRTASLRPGDKTVLQAGMCFHLMSGLWLDDMGITITQPFAVTATGHEPLTFVPRKLFLK